MSEKRFSSGSRIRVNSDVAKKLSKALSKKFFARVGVLGKRSAREDENGNQSELSNADIGFVHEKGSLSRNIPRRSFLEVPLVQNIRKVARIGKIIKADLEASVDLGTDTTNAWYIAHRHLGIFGEQVVQNAFEVRGPGWQPNSPVTIAKKGSDSPLIDTAQLRRSISSDVVERK